MAGQRARRVARQILREISTIVEHELGDPRLAAVTLTSARMTDDLRHLTLSYSCLGTADAREAAGQALAGSSGRLRRQVTRQLRLRFAPAIKFEADESLEQADRIERLLARSNRD
ncbi:MAG: 30S ribosome-binding factor RbfA [Deltaproteobacteria bacterium]